MDIKQDQAFKRLLKKLSALRATLKNDERSILDELVTGSAGRSGSPLDEGHPPPARPPEPAKTPRPPAEVASPLDEGHPPTSPAAKPAKTAGCQRSGCPLDEVTRPISPACQARQDPRLPMKWLPTR